ncbi:MAG: MFS transporter [Chloroflexota bacterium]
MSNFVRAHNLFRKIHSFANTLWWRLSLYVLAAIIVPLSLIFTLLRQRRLLEGASIRLGEQRLGFPEVMSLNQYLTVATAGVIVISAWVWGAIADKVGRRPIFSAGFLLMAVGLGGLSKVDLTFNQIYLYQTLLAVGFAATATMLTMSLADSFPQQHFGKISSLTMIGIIIAFILYDYSWYPPFQWALERLVLIRYGILKDTYYVVGLLNLFMAILTILGHSRHRHLQTHPRRTWRQLAKDRFGAAYNRQTALAFAGAFISRGALGAYLLFFLFWVGDVTIVGDGFQDATMSQFITYCVLRIVAVCTTLVFGFVADYIHRSTAVLLALTFATIGLIATFFLKDWHPLFLYLSTAFIALGTVSTIIASEAFIADLAPPNNRGTIIGLFTSCSALGILTSVGLGGHLLFEYYQYAAPFYLLGFLSFLFLLVYAITLWRASRFSTP